MTTPYNVEINGIPYLLVAGTYRRSTATTFAQKIAQGDTKHQDYTIKSVISQDTFHGGRGDKDFSDPSRYYDSENVQSRIKHQITLAPKPTEVSIGPGFPEYDCTAVDTEELTKTGLINVDTSPSTFMHQYAAPIYGTRKVAVKFTCPAGGMTVTGFSVKIYRDASNVGRDIKGTLYTGADEPTTPVEYATCTKPWSSISTSETWVRFGFLSAGAPISVTLTAATDYWIVLEDESGTATNPRYWWVGPLAMAPVRSVQLGDYYYDAERALDWVTGNPGLNYRLGCTRRMLSQKFTVGPTDIDVTYLKLKLKLTGTKPSQPKDITVRIETNQATGDGIPSGTAVTDGAQSATWTLSTDKLDTEMGWVKLTPLANHVTLSANTTYHIVIYRPDDAAQDDDSWDCEWANDGAGTTYADGKGYYWDYIGDTPHYAAGTYAFIVQTGFAKLGQVTAFCHFFGKVYAAVGRKLYSLDETGAYWTQVHYGSDPYEFPAPITDLISYQAAGSDANQTITLTGNPDNVGSHWHLTFRTQTSSDLGITTDAAGLQRVLEEEFDSKIKPGDVIVEGGPLHTNPLTITFQGRYSGTKVPLITVSGTFSGGTNPAITAGPPASYMMIACAGKPMVSMKSDGTFTNGAAGIKATRWATLRQRLYALKPSSISYSTTGGVGTTDWHLSANVGNGATVINAGAELDGVLYLAKEDGLYKLVSDQEAVCVVPWADMATPMSGLSMKPWQGTLIVPVGHSVLRYSTGQVTPMGLDMDEGLPPEKLGVVTQLVSTLNTLYAGVEGDDDNYCSIWEYNGVGWHNLWVAPEKAKQLGAMTYTVGFGDEHRLWFSWGDSVYYMTIPGITNNPANWLDDDGDGIARFNDSGFLETGWIDGGLPEVTKSFLNLALDTEAPVGTQIDVYYHCDDSTPYRKLATISATGVSTIPFSLIRDIGREKIITSSFTPTTTVFDVAAGSGIVAGDVIVINGHERLVSSVTTNTVDTVNYDQITISAGLPVAPKVGDLVFSGGMAGKRIRLKFVLSTTSVTKTPILKRWTLGLLARPETTWNWQFQVRVQEAMEYLDGSGAYPYTLDQVIDNLRIPCDTPMPVDFKDPDGRTYKAYMTSQIEQERNTFIDDDGNEKMERVIAVALIELN